MYEDFCLRSQQNHASKQIEGKATQALQKINIRHVSCKLAGVNNVSGEGGRRGGLNLDS